MFPVGTKRPRPPPSLSGAGRAIADGAWWPLTWLCRPTEKEVTGMSILQRRGPQRVARSYAPALYAPPYTELPTH